MLSAWDFIGKDTNELTHGFHLYPGVMNPFVARKLISMFGENHETLLDPFCGSGTTLVEAKNAGISADGFDINPIARLISRAKTNSYNIENLSGFVESLIERIHSKQLVKLSEATHNSGFSDKTIQTWFPNKTVQEISTYLREIEESENYDENFRIFAKVSLSDCLRSVSIQRKNEWKNYRKVGWRDEDINANYQPLLPLFKDRLISNLRRVEKTQFMHFDNEVRIFDTNSVRVRDFPNSPENGYELVVTSPPYGDSRTTVAYAEFSWLTNVWLGLDERPPGNLGKEMMGGVLCPRVAKLGHRMIDSAISKMEPGNATKNFSFYRDYLQSISNVAANVSPGGTVCYVVGNRTSGGKVMRMDLFTRWAFEQNDFERIGAIKSRKITNSRMPRKTSPSGKKGDSVSTMNYEYIITCKKKNR